MKSYRIILIIFFCGVYNRVSSQAYIPFPTDNAQWCIRYGEGFIDWNYSIDGIYSYKLSGDTIINEKGFKNISVSLNWQHYEYWDTSGWFYGDYELGNCGAIREEDKRIYFYRYSSISSFIPNSIPVDTEILLYDFNLNLGDTAEIGDVYVVTLLDSVLCNDGIYHKHFFLENYYYYTEWLEGIGDINKGLFGPYIFEFEGFGWTFQGFSLDSVNVYGSAGCEEGGFEAIVDVQQNNFNIYFENENILVIKTHSYMKDCLTEIFDPSGRKAFTNKFTGTENKINVSAIASGVYLIKLSSDNNILQTEKIYKK